MKLKDGSEVKDPRLGRLVSFDERSLKFASMPLIEDLGYRTKYWVMPWVLDQGNTSMCVGNAWTGEAIAEPVSVPNLDEAVAQDIYHAAQEVDEWPGHNYEGTSVLAGAKVMKSRGFITSYRWALSADDAVKSIMYYGPGVMGCNWLENMFDPTSDYFLDVSGDSAGGHAILVYGVQLGADGKPAYVLVKNSWGPMWGRYGSAKIHMNDFAKLLADDGEFCIPVGRQYP